MSHHESLALEAGDEIVANETSTRVIQALPLRSNNIALDIGCSSGLVDGMDLSDERHMGLLDAFRIRRTMMAFLPSVICCPVVGYSTFSRSSYHPRRGWRSPAKYRRQHPLAGRHLFATRLKAALLRRGIVGKARKMRLEARHGEIHECADLWNGKPTLRGNEVHGHCSVLVLR